MNIPTYNDATTDGRHAAKWFRRLTLAGFAFFLAKGLLWVALAVWVLA